MVHKPDHKLWNRDSWLCYCWTMSLCSKKAGILASKSKQYCFSKNKTPRKVLLILQSHQILTLEMNLMFSNLFELKNCVA